MSKLQQKGNLPDSQKLIEQFYSSLPSFLDEKGHEFQVPESGSLGLLAMGYEGLAAWRNARKKNAKKNTTND